MQKALVPTKLAGKRKHQNLDIFVFLSGTDVLIIKKEGVSGDERKCYGLRLALEG